MKLQAGRTFLEVRVGSTQSAEVILHVRRQDMDWFNNNNNNSSSRSDTTDRCCATATKTVATRSLRDDGDIQKKKSTVELFGLLQRSVLPRMFADEVEAKDAAARKQTLPPELGPGGIPYAAGPVPNNKAKGSFEGKQAMAAGAAAGTNKRPSWTGKRSKKLVAELRRRQEEENRTKRKDGKTIHYAVGDTMQLAYRLVDNTATAGAGATLLYNASSRRPYFRSLTKLSKQIHVWCYPVDLELPVDEGFYRPEAIPLGSVFRSGNDGDSNIGRAAGDATHDEEGTEGKEKCQRKDKRKRP
jgi:hypothetical protein